MVSVIILAAGLGTRMNSKIPKVLHKICGKSMIEYVIDVTLGISSDIHIVLFHQNQNIRDYINQIYPNYLLDKFHFHIQMHDKYPGTGGALIVEKWHGQMEQANLQLCSTLIPNNENTEQDQYKTLLPCQGDKIVVINGDTPFVAISDLETLLQDSSDISLGIFHAKNPKGYGRIIQSNTSKDKIYISRIIEDKDCSLEQREISLVNGGIYCFSKEILDRYIPSLKPSNAQNEYYLTDIIALACRDGALVSGHIMEAGNLLGINSRVELANAENIMLDRLRLKAMQQGVTMRIPNSIYIDSSVIFEGECVIENGACITGRSLIKNSHIKAHTVVEDSQVINSDIGPSAHIRPNCKIIDSHIGNFVECKKANLSGVKAGHLSYLGDCTIGEGSNIGAGVITCNYDGKEKHQTIIGKNVFVGSDCQLVAPIEIEDNVLIAAGSTVTKNVKLGSLVIARQKQVNHENGFFRFFSQE
ncbi:bifunctional UDP-N-acetylglucosamine diphosphorylase/glucosamine-1-phosphate N-acetyltransferase GlmU [Helicobacter muridarum]|uniref:Bifunctional protein GlmU n=1 Tax=Helicobacter muridarum TaxID=216 RepID=A0A099TWC2_9HELI|nr:bifunctional UDP-N-acetylglucosamine diphosphorylase/glucosamine-1-phosphate N-acetyltransferase GlmU [Helicobacter muridarum]TLD99628.1 bifunctional UDP-N-acetylglucosamine diphosphorylase/glucosamine-1-phosphate N-acetyltransferase GlmU [Helicobacter muridarum]STQ86758.1 bifunctional N-acetylglucosamine-1-phosphate uridyltransferase/glucosamine-1-phosphate acetyltransferase [Helicobacter muridarum]